jgi:hypothetical protein
MTTGFRLLAFAALTAAALGSTGCSSNNKGKIEGRWKFVNVPGVDQNMVRQLDTMGIYLFIEFDPNGTMTLGAASANKDIQEKLAQSGEKVTFSCKYKLHSGDDVEFYDLPKELQEKGGGLFGNKDRARTKIKVNGDTLTMTDPDGKSGTFSRAK